MADVERTQRAIGAGLKVRRRLGRSMKLRGLESSSSDGVSLPPQFETLCSMKEVNEDKLNCVWHSPHTTMSPRWRGDSAPRESGESVAFSSVRSTSAADSTPESDEAIGVPPWLFSCVFVVALLLVGSSAALLPFLRTLRATSMA